MRIRKILLPLILAGGLWGCAAGRHPAPAGVLMSGIEARGIFEALARKDEQLRSLRALARIHATTPDGEVSYREAVVFVKPDRLRLEALPLQGAMTLSLAVLKGGEVRVLDPGAKHAVVGMDAEGLIRTHTKIPVAPAALMALLAGVVPQHALREGEDRLRLFVDSAQKIYTLVRGDFVEYYRFDQQSLGLLEAQLRRRFDDRLAAAVRYAPARPGLGGLRDLHIELPLEKTSVSLSWLSAVVNGAVAERLFEVEIPADYRVYRK